MGQKTEIRGDILYGWSLSGSLEDHNLYYFWANFHPAHNFSCHKWNIPPWRNLSLSFDSTENCQNFFKLVWPQLWNLWFIIDEIVFDQYYQSCIERIAVSSNLAVHLPKGPSLYYVSTFLDFFWPIQSPLHRYSKMFCQ